VFENLRLAHQQKARQRREKRILRNRIEAAVAAQQQTLGAIAAGICRLAAQRMIDARSREHEISGRHWSLPVIDQGPAAPALQVMKLGLLIARKFELPGGREEIAEIDASRGAQPAQHVAENFHIECTIDTTFRSF
jgi:hypothetical protein